jgi:hypothetical protein
MHSGSFNVIYVTYGSFLTFSLIFVSYLKRLLLRDNPRQVAFNCP